MKKAKRRLVSLILTAAMLVSMGSTAFAETEEAGCDEPEWNEGGLRILGFMEEYADDPMMLAALQQFMEQFASCLTGEMPVWDDDEDFYENFDEYVDEYIYDDAHDVFEELLTPWCYENLGLQSLNGVTSTSTNNAVIVPCCCYHYRISTDGSSITIHGTDIFAFSPILEIPASLRSRSGYTPVIPSRPVTRIEAGAFNGERERQEYIIPNTVTHIGTLAFANNGPRLERVTIGANVTNIGSGAFERNPNLRNVTFRRVTPPTFAGASVFSGVPIHTIVVPLGANTAPTEGLERYRIALIGAGVNTNTARIAGGCRNNILNQRCTCCRYRLGHVSGVMTSGTPMITDNDAAQLLRYLNGIFPNSIQQSVGSPRNANAYNAARITEVTRRDHFRPRVNDYNDIMRWLAGFCSHLRPQSTCASNAACPARHCHS